MLKDKIRMLLFMIQKTIAKFPTADHSLGMNGDFTIILPLPHREGSQNLGVVCRFVGPIRHVYFFPIQWQEVNLGTATCTGGGGQSSDFLFLRYPSSRNHICRETEKRKWEPRHLRSRSRRSSKSLKAKQFPQELFPCFKNFSLSSPILNQTRFPSNLCR